MEIDMYGTPWRLTVHPTNGWDPAWRIPVYIAVIVLSIFASLMLMLLITKQEQHFNLLRQMLPVKVIKKLNKVSRSRSMCLVGCHSSALQHNANVQAAGAGPYGPMRIFFGPLAVNRSRKALHMYVCMSSSGLDVCVVER